MLKSIHVPILIVFLLTLAFLPFAQPVRTQSGCDQPAGQMTRSSLRSTISQTTIWYTVYTPPCYESSTILYPVLYLMHGSNEDDGQWGRLGIQTILDEGIATAALPPMIVVMPFGEWIANQNQFEYVSWENVFLSELLPQVEAQYRIDPRRETRAIGGISRGGFWAFEIAFRHTDLFSSVGGHSAFFAEGNAPPDYDPVRLALNAPNLEPLRIWLDRGRDDYAQPGLDMMHERLTSRNILHDYTIYPEGQHNNAYWRQHVAEYLRFYAATWLTPTPAPTPLPIIFATNTPIAQALPPTTTPAAQTEDGSRFLLLPVVAFPSLQSSISLETLQTVAIGQPHSQLVLDETTAARLAELGVTVNAPTVPDDALLNTLWRDRKLYTLLSFDRLTPRYRVLNIDGLHPLDHNLDTYPFAFRNTTPNFHPQRLTRLLLSGVTALTRRTRQALDENGVEWAAEGIRAYVERPDFFHTSNEVSFSPSCPQADEPPLGEFCSKESHFELFDQLDLDIVELTGNHNVDYGKNAYINTLSWYQNRGILTVGGGDTLAAARTPLILTHHDNSIAMLACNWVGPYYALAGEAAPGAAYCDWDWLKATLPQLAADYDLVIVTTQYLEVEDYRPLPKQVSDFQGLADLGADIVVGTQAHKPQTFEFYNARNGTSAFLHYGLGNLFFDQPFWGNSRFFMDELFIYEGRLLTVGLFTGIIDDLARPRPMTDDEQVNFLAFMFNTQGGM